jgi:hypothetical protein
MQKGGAPDNKQAYSNELEVWGRYWGERGSNKFPGKLQLWAKKSKLDQSVCG